MSLRISAWSVKNPIAVGVLFVALTIVGLGAYVALPIKRLPNVALPIISVEVAQSGAAPAQLEAQVTQPLENAIAGLTGVKHVSSVTRQGGASITVEFELGSDVQKATDDVRTAVERTRAQLPAEVDAPTVQRLDLDNTPILTFALAAQDRDEVALSWFIDDTVARALQGRRGVARVERIGGVEREITVRLDPVNMASRGVTAQQISSALARFVADQGGGRTDIGHSQASIRVRGEVADVQALRDLSIPSGAGALRLSDVAQIDDGAGERRGFAMLDGQSVIGFQIHKTNTASEVAVEDEVKKAISALEKQHPTLRFTPIVSTVKETRASFSSTQHVLLEGMLLAALVVWLFLRDWRATVIAALAMPLSLIPTFAVMALLGFSLNTITLLALTLVIGILVDDAIVEIENVQKRIEAGATPYQAAMVGADAIGLAVVATTLTIVAVFVPVSMMGGTVGQFFREFGLTVSAAVLFSLAVARLLTPLLCAYFLKPHAVPPQQRPAGRFAAILEVALRRPWRASAMGAAAVVCGLGLAATLPTGFQPSGDSGVLYIQVQGPPGATNEDMARAVVDATRRLRREPDVEHVFASVGSGGAGGYVSQGGGSSNEGVLTVLLRKDRSVTTSDFRDRARRMLAAIPDVRFYNQGELASAAVEIVLAGDDATLLAATQARLITQMGGLSQVSDLRAAPSPPGPELIVTPKFDVAAKTDVDSHDLAQVLRVATIGDLDANLAKYTDGGQRVPIRVRLDERYRDDLGGLGLLRVPTRDGKSAPLEAIADLSFASGPAQIVRVDRERRVSVQADLAKGATIGQALDAIHALPVMRDLPPGVREARLGDVEAMRDLFGGFVLAMMAGVGLMYAVLVLLFRGMLKPLVILAALPLSLLGAFAALKVFGMALDMPAMIGLLMLLGLCAKNSILLVEFALEEERRGLSVFDALRRACRERSRPIVMTTVAMGAGMLPTAFGLGEGAEFRQPMALAVIGGLATSTALSLLLVPVAYLLAGRAELWLAPRLGRLVNRPMVQK